MSRQCSASRDKKRSTIWLPDSARHIAWRHLLNLLSLSKRPVAHPAPAVFYRAQRGATLRLEAGGWVRRRLSLFFSVRVRAAARKHFARRIISLCLSAAGSERGKARRHTHSLRLCWEQEQQLAGDSPLANASNAPRTRPRAPP